MRRKFACKQGEDYRHIRIDEERFHGYACLMNLTIDKPFYVFNTKYEVCVRNTGYKWIGIYPDSSNYVITLMLDNNNNIIEWYCDIAKSTGIEKGILYMKMICI